MLSVRFSLFTKIILWFFLNLALIGAGLFVVFNFRLGSNAPYFGRANKIEGVTRQIQAETFEATRAVRDSVLAKYSSDYNADFYLFDNNGTQLGGRDVTLPPEIEADITRVEGPPIGSAGVRMPPPPPADGPPPRPSVYFTTSNPTRYWFVGRIMSIDPTTGEPARTRLVVSSDSYTGHGLYFDVRPFLAIAAGIVGLSFLLWFPFIRLITRDISRMTDAATKIADEDFDVRVSEERTDELGNLGRSINDLAERLSGFVHGQKRFLGDISHELNSPLARMRFALSILEQQQLGENKNEIVADISEELDAMTKLVDELLAYSKAGLRGPQVELQEVPLRALIEKAIRQETRDSSHVELDIPDQLTAAGRPELLSRAFRNVIRNAVRYGGGDILISSQNGGGELRVIVSDNGPGVPEAELTKIFDPLYRLESHRSRETGGSGLGLAIVKTCIEACEGRVSAENIEPRGLRIVFELKPAVW